MRLSRAFKEGMNLIVVVAAKPDLGNDLIGFAKCTITNQALGAPRETVETTLALELLGAVRDILKYCWSEGVRVTPQALWRAWSYFEDPFDCVVDPFVYETDPFDCAVLAPTWEGEW